MLLTSVSGLGGPNEGGLSADVWPPAFATWGRDGTSEGHSHHAIHLVFCREGELRVRGESGRRWRRAAGLITAPDVPHAIDAIGSVIFVVFIDPESAVGMRYAAWLSGKVRTLSSSQREWALARLPDSEATPQQLHEWLTMVLDALGGDGSLPPRRLHPGVRRALERLQSASSEGDLSLDVLARTAKLSRGRFMHVFAESVGIPLRRYLLWRRLQRATIGIAVGHALARAAIDAGFTDAAHMSRTFRRMFGMTPSSIRRTSQFARVIRG
jgi:AraC-like DNA-binding protein